VEVAISTGFFAKGDVDIDAGHVLRLYNWNDQKNI